VIFRSNSLKETKSHQIFFDANLEKGVDISCGVANTLKQTLSRSINRNCNRQKEEVFPRSLTHKSMDGYFFFFSKFHKPLQKKSQELRGKAPCIAQPAHALPFLPEPPPSSQRPPFPPPSLHHSCNKNPYKSKIFSEEAKRVT